ncbi:acyl-CoA dehydrogenase family protein [Blastococcus sp. TF02A-26]|uniref:acyl-CoA dehydrogenase family protein n=1 Tax=Blastococcus sp. TF02A-26 TaxID=2250577 RepID=UPI000DEA417B|nr:acyl-CoA dehydrogenase family protein [Blastococcus sp. TF02A-26]RBY84400.1 acyl-CoA dehydrogenase [Blastococcus sp. TF02A-26]
MAFGLSDDQELFRTTCRRALTERAPVERVRELIGDPVGVDRATWAAGADLGWYAMFVPEELGGGSVSGEALVDAAIVAEEFGRMVHPGPALTTNVVAAGLARAASAELAERVLPGIAAGELIATWAFAGPDDALPTTPPVTATRDGAGYRLDGVASYVPDAAVADLLLVSTGTDAGPAQFLLPRDTPGLEVEPLETLDLARRLATVRFTGVQAGPGTVVGTPGDAAADVEHQLRVALVLQCAETTGATARGLEMTVQYAKDRVAFGRPIGSYQALKHRMADHRMWLEGSAAITAHAARSVQERRPDAAIAPRVAKAHVGRRSTATLHDCIQLHGGIGMTWEYDLHLYFRRVISNEVLLGSPELHQRALVDIAEGAAA